MRTKRLAASLALCSLFVVSVVSPAFAQQTTGTIVGRVLDDQDAAIPGATVVATNPATGFNRESISDAEGVYRLTALPVGRYDIAVQLPGFTSIDQKGVGELVRIGVERGRKAKPGLKVGICGEHGGDPASVAFFLDAGFDYVSCSPFRVPIARLAAAQAAIQARLKS